MAVELPPPQAPQQVTVEQVKAQNPATSIQLKWQDYTLHVIGGRSRVTKADLQEVVAEADSLSNAVRLINAAYYAAGYVGVRLSYALSGQDLYILTDFGKIKSVKAPPELLPYFEGLRGALTDEELEPIRALASVHADRAGKVVDMRLKPAADGTNDQDLEIKKRRKVKADAASVRLEIGNPGNRYVGRNFADLDVRGGIPSGDEFRGFLRHGISQFNKRADASDFNDITLGWNRVTPWGIFGLGYRTAYFDQTIADPAAAGGQAPSQGIIHGGEAYWIGVPVADFTQRLTVNAKIDRLSKQTSTRPTAVAAAGGAYETTYQKEFYNSLELGGTYYRLWDLDGWRFNWETGLSVRKGISGQDGFTFNNQRVQQDYFLDRFSLKLTLNHPEELPLALDTWKFGFDLSTQYSEDVLPEQQQFVLGGANSLTAYLPGVAVGDSGVLFRLRAEWEGVDLYDFKIVPRAFVEYGLAKSEVAPAVAGLSRTQSASDIAAELSIQYRDWLEVTGSTAYEITDQGIPQATLDDAQANYFMKLALKF